MKYAGFCALVGTWGALRAFEPADYTEFINAAMGKELTEEELMLIGRRSYNLEKAFNTIHTGFDRKDDLPPLRYREDPVTSGPHKGEKIDRVKFNQMLDRFYELQGWDGATGLQTRQGLVMLDLEDIAVRIKEAGRLIE